MADWHEEYKRRYAEIKKAGKPFFPYTVLKDTIAALVIFSALAWAAWHYGAGMEALADPTDTTYNPRPEWYFLFLFQALKAFPGSMEAVAAILLPGLGVAFLFFLPLIDRKAERHPLDRPVLTALACVALAAVGGLTYAGVKSPLLNPVVERDPQVMAGARLYRELNCEYCHRLSGKGGRIGPALDKVVGGETDEWLMAHFRDPKSTTPGTAMPKLNLLDEEIRALTAYMRSIGGEPYTKDAPKLFAESCAACHKIGKEGGDVGPDLSLIGTAREKSFIKGYVTDPTKSNPAAQMPAFKGQLTDVQIEDLSRYLSSLGR